MAGRLDAAYRATAARLPGNASVRIEAAADGTAGLSLSALDKLDEPASLITLWAAVAGRMPRVDLPEILSPWTIKSVATRTRQKVMTAAKKEGLTAGQWLEKQVDD